MWLSLAQPGGRNFQKSECFAATQFVLLSTFPTWRTSFPNLGRNHLIWEIFSQFWIEHISLRCFENWSLLGSFPGWKIKIRWILRKAALHSFCGGCLSNQQTSIPFYCVCAAMNAICPLVHYTGVGKLWDCKPIAIRHLKLTNPKLWMMQHFHWWTVES